MVSIIMPAYNVEDKVAGAVEMVEQAMAGVTEGYEVIVVNDGSRDGTRKALEGLSSARIKAVDHEVNLGKGAAIKTGVKHARGEYTMNSSQNLKAASTYVTCMSARNVEASSRAPAMAVFAIDSIIIDADGDIDARDVRRYIAALREYDIVVGSKRHPSSTYEAPLIRKALSLGYNALVKLLLGIRMGARRRASRPSRPST
jgi:glycosyltransferase involved in cell wall biosynthesis